MKYLRREQNFGSKVGGTFSLIFYLIFFYQFSRLLDRMHKGIDDTEKQRLRTNYLRNGENIINFGNSSLLPNLELWSIEGGLQFDSIITSTGINMTELLTYINPLINYQERNENFISFGFDKIKR